ncbi:MAG: helix-turn-helix domain-containing protein [Solirubrobacterales bacterium]|nr:helix-turn-helix domain-containing protein [Solirubrobacterales bacterium]
MQSGGSSPDFVAASGNRDGAGSMSHDRGLSTARAVLCVLSYVAECPDGVSARQVADRLRKSRSTAYHLLASLEAEGYVMRTGHSGRYRLVASKPGAPRPVDVPEPVDPQRRRELRDAMLEAFRRTGRRACIGIFDAATVRVIDEVGRQGIPRMTRLESPLIRRTAHGLAIGKLALANLDESALERYVDQTGLAPLTPLTISDAARLRIELDDVRRRGVATDRCEYDLEFGSVAAAVTDASGAPVAGIGVTVTRAQFAAERDELQLTLLDIARGLDGALASA